MRTRTASWVTVVILAIGLGACARGAATGIVSVVTRPTPGESPVPEGSSPVEIKTESEATSETPVSAATVQPTPTAGPPIESLATFEEASCAFRLPTGQIEGRTVECGYLSVPETRMDPNSRTVRLAVAIFHPPGGAAQPDPILYLEGGPGASILERIWMLFERFSPVLEAERDLIFFDQRGVGLSEPALDCPETAELGLDLLDGMVDGQKLTDQEAYDLMLDSMRACGQELSALADLSSYNSVASAADVNDLRLALGYEQVNLWCTSYGTRLGLGVMRDFPDGLRSVILDSAYPPDVDLYVESPAALDRSLQLLFDTCTADGACEAAYPDLRSVLFETVADLEANPVPTTLTDPLTGESYETEIDGLTLLSLIHQLLYQTEVLPALPNLISQTHEGNLETVRLILGQLLMLRDISSRGMSFSVQCHEELAFSSYAELEAQLADHPELADLYAYSIVGRLAYDVCAFWDSGKAGAEENRPVTSDLPVLILAGEFDPITPPAWGQHASETLPNSIFVEYPGTGHGASLVAGCPQEMMLAYLQDPAVRPDGACVADMGLRFDVPAERPGVELVPFTEPTMGIQGLVPAGWTETNPGVYTRGSTGLDAAVLIAQAARSSQAALLLTLSGQLGLDEPPVSVGERTANGVSWTLYHAQVQGLEIDFSLAEHDSLAMIVLLQSMPSEHLALYEAVFLPVVDSVVPIAP